MLDLVVIQVLPSDAFASSTLMLRAKNVDASDICKSEGRITHLPPLHRLASPAVLIGKMAFAPNCVSAVGTAVVRALLLCFSVAKPSSSFPRSNARTPIHDTWTLFSGRTLINFLGIHCML